MNKIKALFVFAVLSLALSGCGISVKTKDSSGVDGGLFMSVNKAQLWSQIVAVPTVRGVDSISGLDVASLALDPTDPNAVYFGSVGKGLFYSYNLGLGWQKAQGLADGTVNAIAVDPVDKCVIYASVGNKLYVSNDCNRSYEQIYYDNNVQTEISAIAIDHYDNKKLFIGTSAGDVLKSSDRGVSWRSVSRPGYRIGRIAVSSQDSRRVFLTTNGGGMYRSYDSAETWVSLKDNMKEYPNSHKVVDFSLAQAEDALILAVTNTGMLKSVDSGDSWSKVELITSEKDATINTVAVNPKDPKEIYYATRTTFYSSFDAGVSWSAKKLPSTRAAWKLIVKPDQPNVILMGMRKIKN